MTIQLNLIYNDVAHGWLCDHMGHLNTRHIAGMFDDAGMHLMRIMGFSWSRLNDLEYGWVNARDVYEYKAEIPKGALVSIYGGLKSLGNKSLTTYQEMRDAETDKVCATQESTIVCFNKELRKSMLIPEDYRKSLLELTNKRS